MPLAPGSRLGPYVIAQPLGSGGMGEVYRARDDRLGREVAVKILPEAFARDEGRVARFEREAKAIAAISHPNILAIHDLGQERDVRFAVMELLEGETLRERIAQGRLPVRRAVEWAIQIAHGLSAAHDRGVVHRDVKPENLFVTRPGQIKILDFGLATEGKPADAGVSAVATMQQITEAGSTVGTVGYMSPEQARGEAVDHRSDLFSLGCVLFEMLSAERPFDRETTPETMTAILREDPPALTGRFADIPPGLEGIVRHALEKRREERFQTARDFAFALANALSSSGSDPTIPAATGSTGRRSWGALLAAGLLGVALGAAGQFWLQPTRDVDPPRFRPLTFSGRDAEPATSPDGKLIAFTSDRDGRSRIWIKQMAGGGEEPLTEGPDRVPRFSPDGQSILFIRGEAGETALYRISLVGGEPRRIIGGITDADWSPDGTSLALLRTRAEGDNRFTSLWRYDLETRADSLLFEQQNRDLMTPRWSPDGRWIAVTHGTAVGNAKNWHCVVLDAKTGEVRSSRQVREGNPISGLDWNGDGKTLVLAEAGNMIGDLGLTPTPVMLFDPFSGKQDVLFYETNLFPLAGTAEGFSRINVLADGSLVYDRTEKRQNLIWVERANGMTPGAARPLTQGSSRDRQPTVSGDGREALFSSNRNGNLDIYRIDLASGRVRQLTDDRAQDWDPAYSPDGRSVLWSSDRGGSLEIWMCDIDGSNPRQITHDGVDAENPTMTPGGEWIVYSSSNPNHSGIRKIRPDGSDEQVVIGGQYILPDVSPDGRYATYLITDRIRLETVLSVVSVADGSPTRFRATVEWRSGPAAQNITWGRPRWSTDGREILFCGVDAEGRAGIFAQPFDPQHDTSAARRKVAGFWSDSDVESFGIAPDGSGIVVATLSQRADLVLALGVPGVKGRR